MIDKLSSRILVMCNVTNDCNQMCEHCVSSAKQEKRIELKYELIEKLIDSLNRMSQDFMITFVGGEATIWSDFFKMLNDETFKKVKYKMLYTNATAINDVKIKKIRDANFYEVRVSIDSDRKNEHDDLRGAGTFEHTIKSVKKMIEVGIPVTAATVLKKNNVDRLDEIIKFMKNTGIQIIHFIPFYLSGRGILAKEYFVNEEDKEKLIKKLEKDYSDICINRYSICKNGTAYFKIESDGSCCIQQEREKKLLGNLYNDEFMDLYNKAMRHYTPLVVDCRNCKYYTKPILCENMYIYCLKDIKLNG